MKRCLTTLLTLLIIGLFSSMAMAANDDGLPPGKVKQKDLLLLQELQQKAQKENIKQIKKADKELEKAIKKMPVPQVKVNQQIKERLELKLEWKSSFKDVHQHWAQNCINNMVAAGVLNGYPDGTFQPERPISQAEIIALAMRISANDDEDEEESVKDDDIKNVPDWAKHSVKKAAGKKIVNLNRFHSQVQASRAQAVVWIAKAIGLEPVDVSNIPFKDGILISQEDLGYIMAAVEAGIISGTPDGKFNPNSAITRAQIASIIERILDQDRQGPGENAIPTRISLLSRATLEQGESKQLTATVFYSDGATDKNVTWSSSDTSLLTVSSSGLIKAAPDKTGTATITATVKKGEVEIKASCEVTVVKAKAGEGALTSSGNIGAHNGKVYQEFVLKADGKIISLAEDLVESITLGREGTTPAVLVPDTDTALWFNVQKPSGKYILTVEYKDGSTYTAALTWTAPQEITAILTGRKGEHDGNNYVEYRLGTLDLSSFTKMYQIKPDGAVSELTANLDSSLWFKVNNQQEGVHTFLINKDNRWYTTSIEFTAD